MVSALSGLNLLRKGGNRNGFSSYRFQCGIEREDNDLSLCLNSRSVEVELKKSSVELISWHW